MRFFFRVPADIMLLAKIDELYMCLSGPATEKIMWHESGELLSSEGFNLAIVGPIKNDLQ